MRDDALARARRALREADGDLDLTRAYTDSLARAGSLPQELPGTDGAGVAEVEILRHGQRPTLPRGRARIWALAAALALLGGAATGVVALWPEPGGVMPGGTVPASPIPAPERSTTGPRTGPTLAPDGCASPPVPTPSGAAEPSGRDRPAETCPTDQAPSPAPGSP